MCGGDSDGSASGGGNDFGPTNPNPNISNLSKKTSRTGTVGEVIGSILGSLSPVPGGATIGGRLGRQAGQSVNEARNPSAPGSGGFFGSGGDSSSSPRPSRSIGGDGGETRIRKPLAPAQAQAAPSLAPQAAPQAAPGPDLAAQETDRLRAAVKGGRRGTILAGRAIAEEKRKKTLLGQ